MASVIHQQPVEKALADLGLLLRPEWVTKSMSGHRHLNKEDLWRLWLESDMKESSSGVLPVGIGDEEGGTKILPGRFILQVESWENVGEPLEHRSKDSARRFLCFNVTDGETSVRAIEYRHIDGFELKRLNIGLKIAVTSPENTAVIGGCLPHYTPETGGGVDPSPPLDPSNPPQQPLPTYSSHTSHPPPICDPSTTTNSSSSGDDNTRNNSQRYRDSSHVFGGLPASNERTAIISSREDKSSSGLLEPLSHVIPEAPRTAGTQLRDIKAPSSLNPVFQTSLGKNTATVVALDNVQKCHGSSVIVRANVTTIQDRLRLKKLAYAPLPVLIEDRTASVRARISSETCMDLLGGMHATEFKALGKKDIAAVSKIAEDMGRRLLDHEWEIILAIPDVMEDADSVPVVTQMKSV